MNKLDDARQEIDLIDKQMAELFSRRMEASKNIANYKKINKLPIANKEREAKIISKNSQYVDEEYRPYYLDFINKTIKISKDYQQKLNAINDDVIKTLVLRGSTIFIKDHILEEAYLYLNLNRKVLIVSDDNVPNKYVETLRSQCHETVVYIVKHGEQAKSINFYEDLLYCLINNNFTRTDCVVALGGGVVGDLAGFVASTYMRGINFYNIPTTLLSQVDSSIGGKNAINMYRTKNIVGTFYEPKMVLIDKTLLFTLDNRLMHEGLVEAFKMGLTNDKTLVDIIMNSTDLYKDLDNIIYRSLKIKQSIVEKDEKEAGLRRILNFGHTFGHAIEEIEKGNLYHGECVGLGMLYLSSDKMKTLINQFLLKYCLPSKCEYNKHQLIKYIKRDKKADGGDVNLVYLEDIEKVIMKKINIKDLEKHLLKGDLCQMF